MLNDVSFVLGAGKITGVIGPSGSGKTTLIRSLVGQQRLQSGQLTILGKAADAPQLRQCIGYMPQAAGLYTDLTVRQNVAYFASVIGVTGRSVETTLEAVDLLPHAKQLVGSLSGGGRRRQRPARRLSRGPARPGRSAKSPAAPRSGLFCGQRPRYKVYFAARFGRPFAAYGTWTEGKLEPGSEAAADTQGPPGNPRSTARAGAYASFDTRGDRTVTVRVGISFVSVAGARAALAAESGGPRLRRDPRRGAAALGPGARPDRGQRRLAARDRAPSTRRSTTRCWRRAPSTTSAATTSAWTAQSTDARGRTQYADFSGWDVYRTEIPLLALIEPRRACDMVASLLADAEQSGCLPRWPYANGQSMTMVGDSADPIIASAAAFGADRFDRAAALAAMVRGASEALSQPERRIRRAPGPRRLPGARLRPLRRRRQPAATPTRSTAARARSGARRRRRSSTRSTTSRSPSSRRRQGGGDARPIAPSSRRSANWRNLFDPASGMIEPRFAERRLPRPATTPSTAAASSRATPPSTPGWSRRTRPGSSRGWAGRPGGGAPRPFLRVLNGGAGRDPHRPRPARRRADPGDALALRLAAAPVEDAGGGPPRPAPLQPAPGRLSRQRRPRDALGLVRLRRPRPLPGAAGDRVAGARQPALRTRRSPPRPRQAADDPRRRDGPTSARPASLDGRRRTHAPWTTYCELAAGGTLAYATAPTRPAGRSAASAALLRPRTPAPKSVCSP